jgi:hypothetical protein
MWPHRHLFRPPVFPYLDVPVVRRELGTRVYGARQAKVWDFAPGVSYDEVQPFAIAIFEAAHIISQNVIDAAGITLWGDKALQLCAACGFRWHIEKECLIPRLSRFLAFLIKDRLDFFAGGPKAATGADDFLNPVEFRPVQRPREVEPSSVIGEVSHKLI